MVTHIGKGIDAFLESTKPIEWRIKCTSEENGKSYLSASKPGFLEKVWIFLRTVFGSKAYRLANVLLHIEKVEDPELKKRLTEALNPVVERYLSVNKNREKAETVRRIWTELQGMLHRPLLQGNISSFPFPGGASLQPSKNLLPKQGSPSANTQTIVPQKREEFKSFSPQSSVVCDVGVHVSEVLMWLFIGNKNIHQEPVKAHWKSMIQEATDEDLVQFINELNKQRVDSRPPNNYAKITPESEWFIKDGHETEIARMFRTVRGYSTKQFFEHYQKKLGL